MGIKYHNFQHDQNLSNQRAQDTLNLGGSYEHINMQKGSGEDWLRNETSFLQEPVGISLDPKGKVWHHGYL